MDNPLALPMIAHMVLVVSLYIGLTLVRAPRVWGLLDSYSSSLESVEPRISANLSNQFEWPMFFYVACLLAMIQGSEISSSIEILSWIFVVGRVLHSAVQIFTDNVRLRGLVDDHLLRRVPTRGEALRRHLRVGRARDDEPKA